MTDQVTRHELARMMAAAASRIREHQTQLSQLDCIAGDGDHGSAMLRTMNCLESTFNAETATELKTIFCEAGWKVMGSDGGASSSLLGAFFLGIGEATKQDVSSWRCEDLAAAFRSGLEAVQLQTKARAGDKTMMDALTPAIEMFVASAQAGQLVTDALQAAAQAAKTGAESTANLIARYGRARQLGERTRGHPDPGATSIALIFEGFLEGFAESKGNDHD